MKGTIGTILAKQGSAGRSAKTQGHMGFWVRPDSATETLSGSQHLKGPDVVDGQQVGAFEGPDGW